MTATCCDAPDAASHLASFLILHLHPPPSPRIYDVISSSIANYISFGILLGFDRVSLSVLLMVTYVINQPIELLQLDIGTAFDSQISKYVIKLWLNCCGFIWPWPSKTTAQPSLGN